MTITKVKYERLFPIGMYLNEKIGFEAEIQSDLVEEYQNNVALEAVEKLRQLAEDIHKEKYPHFYMGDKLHIPQDFELTERKVDYDNLKQFDEPTKEQGMIELINSKYQTKKTLENLRPQVDKLNNPEITELFLNKLKTFE